MRCVVFGATGYLGVRLVPELLAAGHDVRVMARTPAKLDNVPWRRDVEVVEGDEFVGGDVDVHGGKGFECAGKAFYYKSAWTPGQRPAGKTVAPAPRAVGVVRPSAVLA